MFSINPACFLENVIGIWERQIEQLQYPSNKYLRRVKSLVWNWRVRCC